ncbi:MAG: hypothetical protein OXI15_23250, partial [Chromatiales bacterium]|nr:hypothetical protein [Chromatiales bacterium]
MVGPITEMVEIERTPHRGDPYRCLHPRKRVSVPHAPSILHDLHLEPRRSVLWLRPHAQQLVQQPHVVVLEYELC